MTLHVALLYCSTNYLELLTAAYAVLNIINGLLPESKAKGKLGALMNFLALFTRKDAPGTFKAPLSAGSKPNGVKLNLVPVIALVMAGLTACGFCQKAENVKTLRCEIEHSIVQCGPGAAAALVEAIPYIVARDWSGLLAMLTNKYPAVARCVQDVIAAQLKPADAAAFKRAQAHVK